MILKCVIQFITCIIVFTANAQQVIPLYQGIPPGAKEVDDNEVFTRSTSGNGRAYVTNVTIPTLTVYMPEKINPARTAVVICPGGGYSRLSIEDGGYEAARSFADSGVVAFVLKYRTWQEGIFTDFKTVPMMDLQMALRYIRANAANWKIDTSHLGVLGFSAGGHLTAMAATSKQYQRPAFTLLIYPVISFMDSLTSATSNSRSNLLGERMTEAEKVEYSPELHVDKATSPAFIVHAKDDKTSLVGNSITYHGILQANHVPSSLTLFEKGGHGFAMYNKAQGVYWLPNAMSWLRSNGFVK